MSVADKSMPESSGHLRNASGSYAASSGFPAYLMQSKETSNNSKTKSSASNPYENRSDYTSDGATSQAQNKSSENTPPSKFMNRKNKTSGNGLGWSNTDMKKPKPRITYNAWDNAGQVHSQYHAPSQSTSITGSTGMPSHLNTPASSGAAGGWAKEVGLIAYLTQLHHTDLVEPVQRSTRAPPTQFPPLSRPIKQINYEDDDDSPDEL